MTTVMVVDDHERIRTVLRRLLSAEGHHVIEAANGAEALRLLAVHTVDLIVLDLVMPRTNGMQVLTHLSRFARATPVVVLSAVEDITARVEALDLGAVDFVGKPFIPAELLARVRRHLATRPAPSPWSTRFLADGGVELDLDRRRARFGRDWVDLTDRESSLLAHLMRRSGRVCSRDELLHDVWGLDFDPGSNVVEVCVRRLRAKLPDVPVQTVRSAGYYFEGG
jgi:DNA-binding response OmpR family regulator